MLMILHFLTFPIRVLYCRTSTVLQKVYSNDLHFGVVDCAFKGHSRVFERILSSVAEPHHFYAAPAPGKNFDAALAPADPAPAPAPTLLYSKAKFLKRTKVCTHVETILFI
jgi:hypothetical protein